MDTAEHIYFFILLLYGLHGDHYGWELDPLLLHHLSRGFLLSHSGLLYISVPTGYTLPREDLISIMTYTPSLPLAILIHFPFFYFFWPHLPEDRQPYWYSHLLFFLSAFWPRSDIKDCRECPTPGGNMSRCCLHINTQVRIPHGHRHVNSPKGVYSLTYSEERFFSHNFKAEQLKRTLTYVEVLLKRY